MVSDSIEKSDNQISRSEFIELQEELGECKEKLDPFAEIVKWVKYRERIRNLQNLRTAYWDFVQDIENVDYHNIRFSSDRKQLISQLKWDSEVKKKEVLAVFDHIQNSWENGIRKRNLEKLDSLKDKMQKISEKIKMLNNEVGLYKNILSDRNGCNEIGDIVNEHLHFF